MALRRIIHIAAILLNVFWAARWVWSVWGLIDWHRIFTSNPFGYGQAWLVWVSLLTPLLGLLALLWSFPQARMSQAA